jgi:N-acetylglutamate synthase-like GNAT family acetyltransferase
MNLISVSDLLKKYPNIRTATQSDNDEIIEFIKTVPMKAGAVSLRYERSPDYFAQIRLQSDSSFVLVVVEKGKIAGVTAISVKNIYLNGSTVKTACISDLRVRPGLPEEIREQWRNIYFDLVNHFRSIKELHQCKFMHAIVLSENERILRTFRDPDLPIRHEKMDDFSTYNLLGRLPLPFRLNDPKMAASMNLNVRRASDRDLPALRKHLQRENQDRVMGHHFSDGDGDEFAKRMTQWQGFKVSSFFIAENSEGEIVGCVFPWNSSKTKRLVVESLPRGISIVGQLMSLVGKPRLATGRELKVLYLTHLEIASHYSDRQRQSVFELLLREIYKSKMHSGYHMVSFSDFPIRPLAPGLRGKGFVTNRVPTSAYQLVPKRPEEDPFRARLLQGKHLGYELAVL